MKVGLSAYDIAGSDLVELARAADGLGFESLWLGEHIVLPLSYGSEHPTTTTSPRSRLRGPIIDPSTILVDPLVALSGAAAATSRIRLATGIYLLGLRHPLISARMVATLHEMSGGRFVLGVGSGWLAEEFDALGLEFARRRSRYEEALAILRAAFAGEPFEHHGSEFDFGLVQVCPSPIRVPLVLGGNSDAALRRAASIGDGWFSSGTPTLDHAARLHQRLHELRADLGRTNAFSVHVRMAGASADRFDEYLAAGIDHVVIWADQVWPKDAGPTEKYDVLAQAAQRFGLRGG